MAVNILLGFLVVAAPCIVSVGGVWWTQESALPSNVICRRAQNMFRRGGRTEFCRNEEDVVKTVLEGVQLSVEECQHHFRHRRWNCSSTRSSIRKIVRADYRETAFVFAITSAGISFAVTQACSSGDLEFCTCRARPLAENPLEENTNTANLAIRRLQRSTNQLPSMPASRGLHAEESRKQFEWGGCSDNIVFGTKISRDFMNTGAKSRDLRALIQHHNNRAGRLAVETNMKNECKCTGLSGSCSIRTCWKKMPHFRFVSDGLKQRFDGASRVILSNSGDGLLTEMETIKAPTELDLVYTTDSPNFCEYNSLTGSLGTRGRQCNKTSKAIEGCDLLCCGRPVKTTQVLVTENCRCRFKWCCEVICQECKAKKSIYTCT